MNAIAAVDPFELWTPLRVRGVLAEIRAAAAEGCPQTASLLEYNLHTDVIWAIAHGKASDAVDVAKAAYETGEIEFERSF